MSVCAPLSLSIAALQGQSVTLTATTHYVESPVYLAVQQVPGKPSTKIEAGILPQQRSRHRQRGTYHGSVTASRVCELISRLRYSIDRGLVELAAGVNEMPNARAQPVFDMATGS